MNKYTVKYDDGKKRGSIELNCPDRLPQFGDVYVVVTPFYPLSGGRYESGDLFTVLERTGQVPHHRTSSLNNLSVVCKYGRSVWTCFEHLITEGYLKLKSEGQR